MLLKRTSGKALSFTPLIFICAASVSLAVTAQCFAAADHLRPVSTSGSDRLGAIRKDITAGTDGGSIGSFKTVSVLKDGGLAVPQGIKGLLGEYKTRAILHDLAFDNLSREEIDVLASPEQTRKVLTQAFGSIRETDRYFIAYFRGEAIGIVREGMDGMTVGKLSAATLGDNQDRLAQLLPLETVLEPEALAQAKENGRDIRDVLLDDYVFLSERAKLDIPNRNTVEFSELRQYVYDLAKKLPGGREDAKLVGLALAGGKGLSLSIMEGQVDVPPGFNVTTTGYFRFVKENAGVQKVIDEELRKLDTMDDQKRDVISKKIRDTFMETPLSTEAVDSQGRPLEDTRKIAKEVLVMYRQLNIKRFLSMKPVPTAIAVRSSGTKEDLKIESWLPITTGSQAGQSDTYLNVRGEKNVLNKLLADWASLFTDRAVSYRDDALFLIWSSKIGLGNKQPKDVYKGLVEKLDEYSSKLNNPIFKSYADTLRQYKNPGSVNLMEAIREMLEREDNPELKHCLAVFEQENGQLVDSDKIGIDVVMLQMVKSELAGVLFTVNPATKMAGVAQALYRLWYMGDDSMVYKDKQGNVIGTKPSVVSFEIAYGYGENVVGGKVTPDKFVMGTNDGKRWFMLEQKKGTKLIKMINVEEALQNLSHVMDEKALRDLAAKVKKAIAYDEVGKSINAKFTTYIPLKYLKPLADKPDEDAKAKKDRMLALANDVANIIKGKGSREDVRAFIVKNFDVSTAPGMPGLKEKALNDLISEVFGEVERARTEQDLGMQELGRFFGSMTVADTFKHMVKDVWENTGYKPDEKSKRDAMMKLGASDTDFSNLSYAFRALADKSFTCNSLTSSTHQNQFCITDAEAVHIADMAWKITTFYKDQRDIEFAIEFDENAPEGKRLELYVIDKDGKVMGVDKKGDLVEITADNAAHVKKFGARLYNVQARPYTAGYLKTEVIRARTEVDEKYIEDNSLKPIATGTKGENAAHGYSLVFDPNKSIAWHSEQIDRLKRGEFTAEEKADIRAHGWDPDKFNAENPIKIVLYLLEADPNHDPIMRKVDAVVTIRGGDTCHAAIFCREQGIPAVTAVGKVLLNGRLLVTGDWVTVDANNGFLYECPTDPAKRIPINFIKFRIKPYGIPEDDDNMPYPTIGLIIAATSAAQQNSPIMLAPDSAGNALTRAEFKGEEIGINVFIGYGYDLLQQIKAGKAKRPVKVTVRDVLDGKVENSGKFATRMANEMYDEISRQPMVAAYMRAVLGEEIKPENILRLLAIYENADDSAHAGLIKGLAGDQKNMIEYYYGVFQRRFNFEYNLLAHLESIPWALKEVEDKLKEKGYSSFKEYSGKEFYNFYNLMGFTIAPKQKAKNRSYDFAMDKIPQREYYSWPAVNNLVGIRGAALEIEGFDEEFDGNQKVLDFMLDSVIKANENTHNQAWFYVFVRFMREMDTLESILERAAERNRKLPKQIGIMVEVPSDALMAAKLAVKMIAMKAKFARYGVELTFFSFGTNDYSHLAGKGDREDPRIKLIFGDPAAKAAIPDMKKAGYYYNDATSQLPLVDEGADVMVQLMEAVVKEADAKGVETSLCGEALTALLNRGDFKTAGKIMGLLKSFGISMMNVRLQASMTRYDTMAATKELVEQGKTLFDLKDAKMTQNEGVIKGEIIYVDSPEDLIPDKLKGLKGAELEERKESLKIQSVKSAQSTMRTYNRIVVITRNFVAMTAQEIQDAIGTADFTAMVSAGLIKRLDNGLYVWTNLGIQQKKFAEWLKANDYSPEQSDAILALWQKAWNNTTEGLERQGIDWDDLQYAKAIIVDSGVNLEGWDVFRKEKGIVASRVKATVGGIAALRSELENKFVTIDYASKRVMEGNLKVQKKKVELRSLPIPDREPVVDRKAAIADDANDAYAAMRFHPLMLLAYQREREGGALIQEAAGKIFDEYVTRLADELVKISKENDPAKKAHLLAEFEAKMAGEPEAVLRAFFAEKIGQVRSGGKVTLRSGWLTYLREQYFQTLKKDMDALLGSKTAEQFIKEAFTAGMRESITVNSGALAKGTMIVHMTSSLNCARFREMFGGFLTEQVNPNPDYGILGAARALGDFWQINRLELQAFMEVWNSLSPEQRKLFALQITELKGTQSGALVIGWRNVLKDMNIIPGTDGLVVGVNIATPADTLAVDKYFEYFKGLGTGLSFVSYDSMMLGAAWAGVDIYWNEWRRLAKYSELMEMGDMAGLIVKKKIADATAAGQPKMLVEFAAKDGGYGSLLDRARNRTTYGDMLNRVQDRINLGEFAPGFERFMDVFKKASAVRAGLVIGANTVFENSGTLHTLKRLKAANPGFKVAVWAKDADAIARLAQLDTEKVVDIAESRGVGMVLQALRDQGIADEKIVMINSDLDLENMKDEYSLAAKEMPSVKSVVVHTPVVNGDTKVNSMPLAVARAAAAATGDEQVAQGLRQLTGEYASKGQLTAEQANSLNDLQAQVCEMSLVKVSDETANIQKGYEESISKI
ncbi:MAG: PEP/pyruvate-binding domain-containing protein, partial [Deltaproteobacteria bacterium]